MNDARFIKKKTNLLNKQTKLKSKQPKKFAVVFTREATKNGKFKTKFRVRRIESSVGKERGILHKVVGLKSRFVGDIPSISKNIDSLRPTTIKGKVGKATLKYTYSGTKKAVNLAIQTGLAVESAALSAGGVAQRVAMNTIRQSYSSAAVDDASRGVIAGIGVARATFDGVKTLRQHKRLKRQYKLEKIDYKLKKLEYRGIRKGKISQGLKDYKASLNQLKSHNKKFLKSYKTQLKTAKKSGNSQHVAQARLKAIKRKSLFKAESKLIKVRRNDLKFEKKSTKKLIKSQHKIAKLSNPGFVAFKPFKFGAKKLTASAWQKAVNADNNNDFMTAASKIKQTASTFKKTKSQRLQKQRKKQKKLQKNQSKKHQKLQKSESKLKTKSQKSKIRKKSISKKTSVSDYIKSFFSSSINAYIKEAKRLVISFIAPIIASLLICVITLEIFAGIFSNFSFVLGTYNAKDYHLTQAVEKYTELANNMNSSIKTIATDDWEDALEDLGVDISDMDDDPVEFIWGKSEKFNHDPATYDFDRNKLWSFLCAYYYDFSVKNGDVVYWEYKSDTATIIQELFEKEYQFEYLYEDTSHWENLSTFNFIDECDCWLPCGHYEDGLSINEKYYVVIPTTDSGDISVISEGGQKYLMFKIRGTIPEALEDYDNNNYFYMNLSDGMIYKYASTESGVTMSPTYWYFQDQRYAVQTTNPPYFYKSNGSYKHNSISGDSWMHIEDDFYSESGLTENQIWLISRYDTLLRYGTAWDNNLYQYNWTDEYIADIGEDKYACLARLYQTKEWVDECKLYYNVKQVKTFDAAIKEKLTSMANGTERYNYYLLLIGQDEDTGELFGNHQVLYSMFETPTFRDYPILNHYGYDVDIWNSTCCLIGEELHLGVDIKYDSGKGLFAPLDDCKIKTVDAENNKIILRINSVFFSYEKDGGEHRDMEITIYNAQLISGLAEGSMLSKGQKFATVTNSKKCTDDCVNTPLSNFVHIETEIDTDGIGWDNIDPELLLY